MYLPKSVPQDIIGTMNCPKCSVEMVKAQATDFGEVYDYCRPCGKELKEFTPTLKSLTAERVPIGYVIDKLIPCSDVHWFPLSKSTVLCSCAAYHWDGRNMTKAILDDGPVLPQPACMLSKVHIWDFSRDCCVNPLCSANGMSLLRPEFKDHRII